VKEPDFLSSESLAGGTENCGDECTSAV